MQYVYIYIHTNAYKCNIVIYIYILYRKPLDAACNHHVNPCPEVALSYLTCAVEVRLLGKTAEVGFLG